MKDKRNLYIDVVKGIAIFLVVLGHCIQYGSNKSLNGVFYNDSLFKCIYSFHMPLFMIISGYLFYITSTKYSVKKIIQKRCIQLLIPIFAWNILFGFIDYLFVSRTSSLFFYIKSCFVELWFLWAVFWCGLIVLFISKVCNDRIIFYILSFILCFILPHRFNFHVYTYVYPFFVIGYLSNKYQLVSLLFRIDKLKKYIYSMILIIVYCFMFYHYSNEDYVYVTGVCILKGTISHYYIDWHQMYIDMFRYCIGFLGSALLLTIVSFSFNRINFINNVLKQLFLHLGKRTLGIYAISSYLNVFILNNLSGKEHFNYIYAVSSQTIIMLICTYTIILFLEKSKVMRVIFLGAR